MKTIKNSQRVFVNQSKMVKFSLYVKLSFNTINK